MYALAPPVHRSQIRDQMILRRPRARISPRKKLVSAAVLGLLTSLGLAVAAHGTDGASYASITVQPGDTVWSIAARNYPQSDLRDRVVVIEQVNGLPTEVVHPGEVLRIPTS
jgi:LysM repeat protein